MKREEVRSDRWESGSEVETFLSHSPTHFLPLGSPLHYLMKKCGAQGTSFLSFFLVVGPTTNKERERCQELERKIGILDYKSLIK